MIISNNMSVAQRIVVISLVILIITNLLWSVLSRLSGPLIGLIFYVIIAYLCLIKKHFQAGIVGGILGFFIHAIEYIVNNVEDLNTMEHAFLLINIIFPLILLWFSYYAYKQIKCRD